MSPLPPGSRASTMAGNRSHSRRMAWAWAEKTLGIATDEAMTKGTAPSHTSGTFSKQLTVLRAPPLPPKT